MAKAKHSNDVSPVEGITEETTIAVMADEPQAADVAVPRYIVTTRFCYEEDFSRYYEVGEDVSHFDTKRLQDLKNQMLIKEVS